MSTSFPGPTRYTRAFSSLGCPELGLGEVLELARRHDIAAVELRALEGSVDLPEYFGRNAAAFPRHSIEGVAGSIASLSTSLRLAQAKADDRTAFLRFVPWAEKLGVPRLRVFDGDGEMTADVLAEARGVVKWWREQREAQGWRTDLMVETHGFLNSAASVERFLAAVPGVAILWDSHHTWSQGGESPLETWRAIRRHVVHIHIKDSVADGSGGARRYVLPGTGEFPMTSLRDALREEFAGPVSLEWERLWHPELPALESALASAAATNWW